MKKLIVVAMLVCLFLAGCAGEQPQTPTTAPQTTAPAPETQLPTESVTVPVHTTAPIETTAAVSLATTESTTPPETTEPFAPPVMYVKTTQGEQETVLLGGKWETYGYDQEPSHPLDCQSLCTPIFTTDNRVRLTFDKQPIALRAAYWPGFVWGNTSMESTSVEITEQSVDIYPGAYIFHVQASWPEGECEYVFYIIQSES